jgi:hypothetical protein
MAVLGALRTRRATVALPAAGGMLRIREEFHKLEDLETHQRTDSR